MKLYRRSWERQVTGRAGAISSPLAPKNGTGSVSGATAAAPVSLIAVTGGSAVAATDVGRPVILESTQQGNRYNWRCYIDSVNVGGQTFNVRFNHNTGATASPMVFRDDTVTDLTWRIPATCTFTADASGDLPQYMSGSYITVEGATNADNNSGQWEISHWLTTQTCMLAKGWLYYQDDYISYAFFERVDYLPFIAESSLRWFVSDRSPVCGFDLYQMVFQFYVDTGWVVRQVRGQDNGTRNVVWDHVLTSVGEDNSKMVGTHAYKNMHVRINVSMPNRSGVGQTGNGVELNVALFQHWDPLLTNGGPGDGAAPLAVNNKLAGNPAANMAQFSIGVWTLNAGDLHNHANAGFPRDGFVPEYTFFGDCDEMIFNARQPSSSNSVPNWSFAHSWLQPVSVNPYVMEVTAPVAAGTNVPVNVGAVDPTALAVPYAVGDNITIMGYKSSSPSTSPTSGTAREYIETCTIVGFDFSDMANIKIQLDTVVGTYGNGPDLLKAQIGEDPFPLYMEANYGGNNGYPDQTRLHNYSRYGNGTGHDWDAANFGLNCTGFQIVGAVGYTDPDTKSGKWGMTAWGVRFDNLEFRGRMRYCWRVSSRLPVGARLVDRSTSEAYVFAYSTYFYDNCPVLGPMTKAMALVRD